MELNEMEKKLLFQVEGDYQTKMLPHPQCVFGPAELHSPAAQQNASCRFMKPVRRLLARLPEGSYRQMGGIDE